MTIQHSSNPAALDTRDEPFDTFECKAERFLIALRSPGSDRRSEDDTGRSRGPSLSTDADIVLVEASRISVPRSRSTVAKWPLAELTVAARPMPDMVAISRRHDLRSQVPSWLETDLAQLLAGWHG